MGERIIWIIALLGLTFCTQEKEGPKMAHEPVAILDSMLVKAERVIKSDPATGVVHAMAVIETAGMYGQKRVLHEAQYLICNTPPTTIPSTDAIQYCKDATTYFIDEELKLGELYNSLGILFDVTGQKDSSIQYFEKAEVIFQDLKLPAKLGEVYNNKGVTLSSFLTDNRSLELYFKRLETT